MKNSHYMQSYDSLLLCLTLYQCYRIEMEDWEHVTTCKNLMLSSQETHTGHKGFICVGTTHVYGEDITCRGRVLYDLSLFFA